MKMKNLKKKLSSQHQVKPKKEEKELSDINQSIEWKKERESLFKKIFNLEKELNSLKTKNQELQIQLTLTQSSIESKKSLVYTDENKNSKRKIDHKRIYSDMFTSYRKKILKQNSEDSRSGLGVLKQNIKQKPKSFGECTNEIIGNKILSNIIKEFRIDLDEQKKLKQNLNPKNAKSNNSNGNNKEVKRKNLVSSKNNGKKNNMNKFKRKKIILEAPFNNQNASVADDSYNKTYNHSKKDDFLMMDLNENYYEFYKRDNINNFDLNENLIINNDDFTEKINESSSGQTIETILKKPNDFNSNINTSISNSLSNSTIKKSNSINNGGGSNKNSRNGTKEQILKNNITPQALSQNSSMIFQPYTNMDGFSSVNSMSSKWSGGRKGPICVLKFHLDSVRGIYVDPFQKVLTSVSEDRTLALWDLEKILKFHKEEEPFLVFRIHTTPIFTITGLQNKNIIGNCLNNASVYTSGTDGVIRGVQIPSVDKMESEENLNKYTLLPWRVHQDMIWQLNYHPTNFLLSSVSSDGTVKIFKTYELYEENNKSQKSIMKKFNKHHYYHYENSNNKNLVRNFLYRNRKDNIIEIPTSCDWRPDIASQIIVSHIAPLIKIYDIETGKNIKDYIFESEKNLEYESKQVNKIKFFNNDLFITGHEDKHIKFFDIRSNTITADFVAHTDAVNDLCKGFNEYQLLTCSQDGNVRSWDLRGGKNKLIFDIPAHRKKYDEGCFSLVTFKHRGENYFVSCGADGCIKIFSAM